MKKFFGLLFLFLVLTLAVNAKDMRFAQISDIRFNSADDENNSLEKVIKEINKQKNVEFVIFTGDCINKPDKNDLDGFLSEAKKLDMPFYIVIGDKDVNKHKGMSKKDFLKIVKKHVRKFKPEEPNYVFEYNDFVFIVVDGSKDVIPGTNGFYKEDVLTWLDEQLTLYSKNNVIIFQHFPLIPPSDREAYYTFKPENYLALLSRHNNVKAVISGHFGVNNEKTVNGIVHISTAGVPYYRIIDILDYDTNNPTIWAELKEIK